MPSRRRSARAAALYEKVSRYSSHRGGPASPFGLTVHANAAQRVCGIRNLLGGNFNTSATRMQRASAAARRGGKVRACSREVCALKHERPNSPQRCRPQQRKQGFPLCCQLRRKEVPIMMCRQHIWKGFRGGADAAQPGQAAIDARPAARSIKCRSPRPLDASKTSGAMLPSRSFRPQTDDGSAGSARPPRLVALLGGACKRCADAYV